MRTLNKEKLGRAAIVCALCLCLLLMLAGCGDDSASRNQSGAATVDDVLEAGTSAASEDDAADMTKNEKKAEPGAASIYDHIDVDLTELSSTMVYSEVYAMCTEPNKYTGKVVKMDGNFAYYYDDLTDKEYFACIVQDATACCSQGIEFVLKGDHKYPDDYPAEGEYVCVVGQFDSYYEDGYIYCTLIEAEYAE